MKREAGFTIIELVIALSIMVFISMIAIPTYNNLILKQADIAEADQVVTCLKQAQAYAAAPPAQYAADDMHFVQVTISNNTSNNNTSAPGSRCQISFNDSNNISIGASLQSYSMSSLQFTGSNGITQFDVTKKGLPTFTSTQVFTFSDTNQYTSVSVTMGATGLPITVAVN